MPKIKLAIASDHAGFELKKFLILEMKDVEFLDLGPATKDAVDYPDFAAKVCEAIVAGKCERGILVCGTGLGVSIAANKFRGIRAAHVESIFTAKMSAQHNRANVLCLGERVTGLHHALAMARAWLETEFESRHQGRVNKITALEGK